MNTSHSVVQPHTYCCHIHILSIHLSWSHAFEIYNISKVVLIYQTFQQLTAAFVGVVVAYRVYAGLMCE